MKRAQLIEKLISEGFSEKTLVNFNDNQLQKFANKFLKEAQMVTTTKTVYNSKDPKDVSALNNALKDPKVDKSKIEVKEDEVIPVSKIKAAAKKKSKIRKGSIKALNLKKLNEFVENTVDSTYHSLVTKGDMVSLIKEKLNESNLDTIEKESPKIPEFMSFDSILGSAKPKEDEPDIEIDAPTKEPDVDRPEDPRRSPFRNPDTEPVVEPDPKAKIKKLHNPISLAAE